MANNAKKYEEQNEQNEPADYINWQEFNRLIKLRDHVPEPGEDSKDDDNSDELDEVLLGKDYAESPREDNVVLADTPSAARDPDNQLEDREQERTAPSSLRPDPKDDSEETSTH